MYRKTIVTISFYIILSQCSISQTVQTEPLDSTAVTDSSDTTGICWARIIKSAIVPGLGQIDQDNPARALFFYGTGATFFYW